MSGIYSKNTYEMARQHKIDDRKHAREKHQELFKHGISTRLPEGTKQLFCGSDLNILVECIYLVVLVVPSLLLIAT